MRLQRSDYIGILSVFIAMVSILLSTSSVITFQLDASSIPYKLFVSAISVILAALATTIAIHVSRLNKLSSRIHAFISYAREDENKAFALYERLKNDGFDTWIDIAELQPGDNWATKMEMAIQKADFFVPLISRNSKDKRGYLQKELKVALDMRYKTEKRESRIIPVRLEKSEVPEPLAKFQSIDLFQEDGITKLEALLTTSTP